MAAVRMMRMTDKDEMSIMIKTSLVFQCHLSLFTQLLSLNDEFFSERGSGVVFLLWFLFIGELSKLVVSFNNKLDQ